MTDGDIDFMAARLKPLLVEDLVLLAENANEPVAFMMSLPDYNEAMKPLKGKLLTPKLLGFLAYLLGWKKPKMTRLITLGIKTAVEWKLRRTLAEAARKEQPA